MKKSLILGIAAAALLATSGASVADNAPRARHRHHRQEHRIAQGVRSGSLTPREAMRLERGQAHVHRQMIRAHRDGKLTWRERARIERAQDAQSKRIFRAKHNRRGC
jgi:hypothetical protein